MQQKTAVFTKTKGDSSYYSSPFIYKHFITMNIIRHSPGVR